MTNGFVRRPIKNLSDEYIAILQLRRKRLLEFVLLAELFTDNQIFN